MRMSEAQVASGRRAVHGQAQPELAFLLRSEPRAGFEVHKGSIPVADVLPGTCTEQIRS